MSQVDIKALTVGTAVWLQSSGCRPFLPASVESLQKGQATVLSDQLDSVSVPVSKLRHRSLKPTQDLPDLMLLDTLNESEILHYLSCRFRAGAIYSRIGEVLLSINPYKDLPGLYTFENELSRSMPHIYSLAGLVRSEVGSRSQAIVISGQSGTGKTENAKRALSFLARSQRPEVEEHILACNPILECFGNARTSKNDNSSRFGKFIKMHCDESGLISGATVCKYLLEKSRVSAVPKGESNYHYLQHVSRKDSGSIAAAKFAEAQVSFAKIGLDASEIQQINSIALAVGQTPSLQFDQRSLDDHSPCTITDRPLLESIALRLRIPPQNMESTFLYKERKVLGTLIRSTKPKSLCQAARNAFSRGVYQILFDWLIAKINERGDCKSQSGRWIGLLDIFGFQSFKSNSLEQLFINFTNQRLHQLFLDVMLVQELNEYRRQGLLGKEENFLFKDNSQVIQTLEAPPRGLFPLLSDSCRIESETDKVLFQRILRSHEKNELVEKALAADTFIIRHSQGPVAYNIRDFRAKNTDQFGPELGGLLASSESAILRGWVRNDQERSLADKFSRDIGRLVAELRTCKISFVKCMKPNEEKTADLLDQRYLLQQIRHLGLLETVRIRSQGFPVRIQYDLFKQRYATGKQRILDGKAFAQRLLSQAKIQGLVLGATKIYCKKQSLHRVESYLAESLHRQKCDSCNRIKRQYLRYRLRKRILRTVRDKATAARLSRLLVRILSDKIQLTREFELIKQKAIYEKAKPVMKPLLTFLSADKPVPASCVIGWHTASFNPDPPNRLWLNSTPKPSLRARPELTGAGQVRGKALHQEPIDKAPELDESENEKMFSDCSAMKTEGYDLSQSVFPGEDKVLGFLINELNHFNNGQIWPNLCTPVDCQAPAELDQLQLVQAELEFQEERTDKQESLRDMGTVRKADLLTYFTEFMNPLAIQSIGHKEDIGALLDRTLSFQKTKLKHSLLGTDRLFPGVSQSMFQSVLKATRVRNSRNSPAQHLKVLLYTCQGVFGSQSLLSSRSLKRPGPSNKVHMSQGAEEEDLTLGSQCFEWDNDCADPDATISCPGFSFRKQVATPLSAVRDELYFQLVKQTRRTPGKQELQNTLRVLLVVAQSVAPSMHACYPLASYLWSRLVQFEPDSLQHSYFLHAFRQVSAYIRAYETLADSEPSDQKLYLQESDLLVPRSAFFQAELAFLDKPCSFSIKVCLPYGAPFRIAITPSTSISSVKARACAKAGLGQLCPYLGIYAVRLKGSVLSEYSLQNEDKKVWQLLFQNMQTPQSFSDYISQESFGLLLGLKLFYPFAQKDPLSTRLYFQHFRFEFGLGRFPCIPDLICRLLALLYFREAGPWTSISSLQGLRQFLRKSVPRPYSHLLAATQTFQRTGRMYKSLQLAGVAECEFQFLQTLRRYPTFPSHHFKCRLRRLREGQSQGGESVVELAVRPSELVVLQNLMVVERIPQQSIARVRAQTRRLTVGRSDGWDYQFQTQNPGAILQQLNSYEELRASYQPRAQ